MTNRERERETLNFGCPKDRGSVEETFYPWDLTLRRFEEEGLPNDLVQRIASVKEPVWERYFKVSWGEPVMGLEKFLGLDPVRRIKLLVPVIGAADGTNPLVKTVEDWNRKKEEAEKEISELLSDEYVEKAYGALKEGHRRGDYSLRMNIEGFFWIPRELLGVEAHMYAFYDEPEMIHDMNSFVLDFYTTWLEKICSVVQPDILYIQEDLSGKNGPMISPEFFQEFIGRYYKRLIPLLKKWGVGNVFVDTDGDFEKLIPDFMECGVDGFLPMDVNAGMDIVKVREKYPKLKFIGSFNKLEIGKGREAIDREFERILPVIRQGGYLPSADHQIAPGTSLENYRYYISQLTKVMREAGKRNRGRMA